MLKVMRLAPGKGLSDAFAVRTEVFVEEQGFSHESEFDSTDALAHHVVLYDGDKPVATGRVFPSPEAGTWIVGRVCILKSHRNGGHGRQLMEELERSAVGNGAKATQLGAQRQAEGFYEKMGYKAFGEPYMDEHCEHIQMKKMEFLHLR